MFIRSIPATAAIAFTSFAHAEGPIYDWPQQGASTLTRAEVRQAAVDARNAGQLVNGERVFVAEVTMGPSQVVRAQVLAELDEARRLGLVGGGEILVFPTPVQNEQIRLAGLRAAMTMAAAR